MQPIRDKLQESCGKFYENKDALNYAGSDAEIIKQVLSEFPCGTMIDRASTLGKLMLMNVGNGYTVKIYIIINQSLSMLNGKNDLS